MPSPFASRRVATIPIPFDPPHTVTITGLSGRHWEKAELAAQRKFMESIDERGGAEAQKKVMDLYDRKGKDEPKPEPDSKKPANPLAGLDLYTLCRFGITAWSYDESLTPEKDEATGELRIKAIDDFGPEELEWFATQVARKTKPSLFASVDEHKESEKNDSAA